jgi:hypothetical protein
LSEVADGVVGATFGVKLLDEHYEAHRGEQDFRGGLLVRVQIGRFPAWEDPAGLTVGFTLLPTITGKIADEFARCPAVTRVYARGVLDAETEHEAVYVNTDNL